MRGKQPHARGVSVDVNVRERKPKRRGLQRNYKSQFVIPTSLQIIRNSFGCVRLVCSENCLSFFESDFVSLDVPDENYIRSEFLSLNHLFGRIANLQQPT